MLNFIKASKEKETLFGCAASNCITVLNLINFNFKGMDFSCISCPKAQLQKTDLSMTNFQNANLSSANFTMSKLNNVNFKGTDLTNVNFGMLPDLRGHK